MNLVQRSPEVFVAQGPISVIGAEEIELLKLAVSSSPKGRVRINAHLDGDDPLHEMFIAIRPESYIRPHKHRNKSESFHVIHGSVDIVIFEDDGRIRQVVKLAAGENSRAFYYRMSKPCFHSLVIRSDILIVHEITNGPFHANETIFAAFSPEESDVVAIAAYQEKLVRIANGMGSA